MKSLFASGIVVALLLPFTSTLSAEDIETKVTDPATGGELATLEKMLLGTWLGGACVGDYTFKPDSTYELINFTPGNNTLTGTWSVRWDALPPTLVLVCKTSDIQKRDATRVQYEYLGKPLELKLIELNRNDFAFQFPGDKRELRFERPQAEELIKLTSAVTEDDTTDELPGKISERLKKKIDVDFQRIPLQDAFAFIGEEIKATIEIDGDALKAGGFTKNMPQTFKKQQITALEAIAMILQKYQTTHKPEQSMVIVVDEDKKKIIVSTEGACKVKKLTPYKVFKKE